MIPTIKQADRNRTPTQQLALQRFIGQYASGVDIGLRDMLYHKEKYDRVLRTRDFSRIRAMFVTLSDSPAFMASGAFFPEVTFDGQALQDFYVQDVLELLSFSLVSSQGKGLAVFSWLEDAGKPVCERLVNSYEQLNAFDHSHALTRFVFEFLENTYLAPIWWDALHPSSRLALVKRLEDGAHPIHVRPPNCLADDGLRVVTYQAEGLIRVN